MVMLDAKPEIPDLFAAYMDGWRAWSAREIHRRKTITLYRKLFLLQQTVSNEGADQPIELVWGMALAIWSPPDGSAAIAHPLLTQGCEISINPGTFAIEIRPGVTRPKLEVACYAQMGLVGVKALEIFWRVLQENGGDVLSPFDESTFKEVAHTAVSHLDPAGKYEVRAEDLRIPIPGPRLTILSTWNIFARKRSGDLIIDDIKSLKVDVERNEVPSLIVRFVKQAVGAISMPTPKAYRGISSGSGAVESASEPVDLLFPLPYNREQVTIVERLDHADGVVVQGPPGTGKSHTIANIICHYLASGQRILVTAKSEAALAVIREKLPKQIQPLCVALLSGESDGNRQFESNVRTIDEELSRWDPALAKATTTRLQDLIDKLHCEITETDKQIDARARPNIQPVLIDGRELPIAELARQVVDGEILHCWFDDAPSVEPNDALTAEVIEALRRARRHVGPDLKYLDDVLPAVDGLPPLEELMQTHHDLQRAAALEHRQRVGSTLALLDSSAPLLPDLQALRQAIVERNARLQSLAKHEWAQRLVAELRSAGSHDPVVSTLRMLVDAAANAELERRNNVAKAIEVPDGAERDVVLRQALARLAKGGRAFLLPFGHAEQRKMLLEVRIAGKTPTRAEDWALVEGVLAWRDGLQRLCAQWSSLADELQLPTVAMGVPTQTMRSLTTVASVARAAIALAYDDDRTLVQWIGKTFANCTEAAPANILERLDSIIESIDAHLEHTRVIYALDRRRVYLNRLAGCTGELAFGLATFFNESLGSAIGDDELRKNWRELNEELIRRTNFSTALQTIRETTELILQAGAPRWANRLRRQPQDPSTDLDPLVPPSWAQAWTWRRQAEFLQRIDAHHEIRRLFAERDGLTRSLATTYQELAAARTWFRVGQRAGADVRGALKAYLTAVLAMGKGTGKNAVLLRRDAKRAMASAYLGVPCWILPHWRVSEALPAKIGLFDLVIVDEASQSDLSCLPAILRGKKLLVVGDDKQVSPSTVGVAVETLSDLRNRYLSAFPENIGPLMLPGRSLYDLANVVFAGQGVMLREHFRSVAPIIQWSNQHYYDNKIVPLRVPTAAERLEPPLVDVHVQYGKRRGEVNPIEAQAIVDEIKAICAHPTRKGRTIGVVTLLGNEQAHLIHTLVANQVPPSDVLARHISVGPPSVFQGRERDIMLISMVIDRDSHGAADRNEIHQRHNVAMSRARDQMILFRSVTESDVSDSSPSARILSYFRQPTVIESQSSLVARDRCESPFELEVYDELVERGFRVSPQVKAGPYRIDLVVEDGTGRRLAVECDGDRYHGPGQWSEDMARQRVLERAGWTFWRCFASTWTRRRNDCVDDLLSTLDRLGISRAPPTLLQHLVESRVYSVGGSNEAAEEWPQPIPAEIMPAQSDVDPIPNAGVPSVVSAPGAIGVHEASERVSQSLIEAMFSLIPADGSSIGNVSLRRDLELRGFQMSDEDYFRARNVLIDRGVCETGRGRGGSVRRIQNRSE